MFKLPAIENDVLRNYENESNDRRKLQETVARMANQKIPIIPIVVNGKEFILHRKAEQLNPANKEVIAEYSMASVQDVEVAITGAMLAKVKWEAQPFHSRAAIFLKAADIISSKLRYTIMAATMLGQGKNIWQAEIDAAAELVDFLRFNCKFAEELYAIQPAKNSAGTWNRTEYRALEGFVYAIAPFNFTAIAGNLACAPALMGNVVILKPSPSAVYSNYIMYQALVEAGLPPGVIQFLPGDAREITEIVLASKDFAALHYTGSTAVFKSLYQKIAANIDLYRQYPRIVGETGGKNFHLVHQSAEIRNAVVNTVRGAFEYQGQKCSACSRLYVSSNVWKRGFKDLLIEEVKALKVGAPTDNKNFVGPVIHEASFKRLSDAIKGAKSRNLEILVGGSYDDSIGYYIHPAVVLVEDPRDKLMTEELFGPILAVYVYQDESFDSLLSVIDSSTMYGLTGAIFATDRQVIEKVSQRLHYAAGNFYINDKCTGAVVSQQPFGGARGSGTNDKAGSMALLWRFVSIRSIKENMQGADTVIYPSN